MKTCLFFVIAIFTSVFAADSTKLKISSEERAARKAKFYEIQMRKNGGIVIKPGSQQGHFLIAYEKGNINSDIVEAAAGKLRKGYRIDVRTKSDAHVTVDNVETVIKQTVANLVLFIVNDKESDTTMLVAPENKWAIINVAPLCEKASKEISLQRIEKEIMRSFAILSGSFSSQFPDSLLSAVKSPSDLDSINEQRLPHDVRPRVIPYLASFGITPYVQANYRRACEQGWAPAPTNEYQKAIWDKVHALPTTPIKIKPETKKVTR